MPQLNRSNWSVFLVFGCLIAFHLFTLHRFPPPFVDEATTGDRALALLRTGSSMGAMDAGLYRSLPGGHQIFTFFPSAFYSSAIWISGGEPISLNQLRAVNFTFGMLALFAFYLIASRIVSWQFGCLAVIMLGSSQTFAFASHCARPDIIAVALGLVALSIHVSNTKQRLSLDFLAGLVLGLAFEVHPRVSVFGPVLGLLLLARYQLSAFKSRNCWTLAAGCCLGLSFFILRYVLKDPEAFTAAIHLSYGPSRTPPIVSLNLAQISDNAFKVLRLLFISDETVRWFPAIECTALLLSLLRNNSLQTRQLLALMVGGYLSALCLVPNFRFFNLIIIDPFVRLALAHFLLRVVSMACQYRRYRLVMVVPVLAMIPISQVVSSDLKTVAKSSVECTNRELELSKWVSSFVKPEDRILGTVTFWLWLQRNHFTSWENLPFYQRFRPELSLEQVMEFFRPDLLIVDGRVEYFLSDKPYGDSWRENMRISASEFAEFLSRRGKLLGQQEDTCNGTLRVYRLQWEEKT